MTEIVESRAFASRVSHNPGEEMLYTQYAECNQGKPIKQDSKRDAPPIPVKKKIQCNCDCCQQQNHFYPGLEFGERRNK